MGGDTKAGGGEACTSTAQSVPCPGIVEPSLNVTVPVGVPLPGAPAATVAVKVTDWPKTDGFADDVTEVVVASLVTVSVRTDDTLPVKLLSPP